MCSLYESLFDVHDKKFETSLFSSALSWRWNFWVSLWSQQRNVEIKMKKAGLDEEKNFCLHCLVHAWSNQGHYPFSNKTGLCLFVPLGNLLSITVTTYIHNSSDQLSLRTPLVRTSHFRETLVQILLQRHILRKNANIHIPSAPFHNFKFPGTFLNSIVFTRTFILFWTFECVSFIFEMRLR